MAHTLMLRASSEFEGGPVDLEAVTAAGTSSGVAHGDVLAALAEAMVGRDDEALTDARRAVLDEMGPDPLVDAVAVASNFERAVRIADATGIPLDAPLELLSEDLRDDLDLVRFDSAATTPVANAARQALGRVLRPVARASAAEYVE